MSERITINLTEPKEEIKFTLTDQSEEVFFSFSEAARGPQGEPGPDASVTNANVNAAIESNPSATRDSLDLGTAALADTGTGASNVILGNDARLTDARTPTAHASSHVTGGTDKIRDASAAQDGLMTTTFAAKLNGIEAGADVTDATNVNAAGAVMESDYSPSHSILVQQSGTGSPSSLSIGNNTLVGRLSGGGSAIDDLSASQVRTLLNVEDGADVTDAANVASTIHAATSKTTPVDADEIPIADSAASFGLKKLTFANLKATLKTYLDTLYVGLTGDQTVAGTKTFGQIKIPGPYADDIAAAVAGVLDDRLYFQPAGSVVANVDHLSLDLQFAADKTLTARKGPTPTFTRASTATFVGSNGLIQSAAVNAARFDHDPVTLACKGLLIEEARTNLVLQSEGFSTASWQKLGSTITADSIASPNGTVTADLLVEDVGLLSHIVQQSTPSLTAGQSYNFSVFAKAGSHTSFQITLSNAAFGIGLFANFVLTGSGSVGTSSGLTTSIQSYPDGWYRCSIAVASAVGGAGGAVGIAANANNSSATRLPSYLGTGAQVVHLWGAQLELGSFPTSYIPTVASSVVRSADVCSITGSDFTGMYNQSEGTMLVNAFTPANGDRTIFAADDNTANEMIRLRTEGTNPFFKVSDGGVELVAIDSGTVVANTNFKLAGAYKLNDFASSINGGAAVTDTSGTIPTVDRIRIGTGQSGNTMCGCIASARYFKKRLTDAKLVTITT
jgi:hypothetical protein